MDTRKNLKDTRWEISKKRGQKTEYKVTKKMITPKHRSKYKSESSSQACWDCYARCVHPI